MDINQIQQQLFQIIKNKMPPESSVADEVGKLLNISSDSAYRRMRGEKQITFEEVYILANHYKISLDQLMVEKENVTIFIVFLFSFSVMVH